MNNPGALIEAGLRNSPEDLSWWTRFRFRRAVTLVNRAFERFPGLASGITRLENAEAMSRKLERQLKESEKKKKELEIVLGQTLAAAETVMEEMSRLRFHLAGQFRQTSTLADRLRSDFLDLLGVADGTFTELGQIRAEVARFHEPSRTASDGPLSLQLKVENDRLQAEMAALTAEVAESQSQTALEIEKLRKEIKRLGGNDA